MQWVPSYAVEMDRPAPDQVNWKVTRQGDSLYTVSGDLSNCTCQRFKQLRVICQHALAAKLYRARDMREADGCAIIDRVHKGYLLSSQLAIYSTTPILPDLGNLVAVAYEFELPPLKPKRARKAAPPRKAGAIGRALPEPVGLDDEDLDGLEWGPTGLDGSLLHPVVPQGLAARLAQLEQLRVDRQREACE